MGKQSGGTRNSSKSIVKEQAIFDGNKLIDIGGRKIVLVKINGVSIPFYVSTGKGGKQNVQVGKWYPFFGIDKDGWFNKGTQEEINNFYGSSELKKIALALDKKYGDIRFEDNIQKINLYDKNEFEDVRKVLNQDVHVITGTYAKYDIAEARFGDKDAFYKRINGIISRIKNK